MTSVDHEKELNKKLLKMHVIAATAHDPHVRFFSFYVTTMMMMVMMMMIIIIIIVVVDDDVLYQFV